MFISFFASSHSTSRSAIFPFMLIVYTKYYFFVKYALLGSTVRFFLSSLYHEGRITYRFENNKMMWEVNK